MHPDDLQIGTTVGFANATRITFSTAEKWFDDDQLAWSNRANVASDSDHGAANFVSTYYWILSIGIFSRVDIKVSCTDAGCIDRNHDIFRPWFRGGPGA
jgi:hypothetical protein